MPTVRPLIAEDKSQWLPLWDGYLEFYKTDISDEQTELTWSRLLDENFNLYCLVVEIEGAVKGLTHYSFQNSTWAPKNYCYLEDLFTDPASRGMGLGRLLIDAVKEVAIKEGSSRLYWNTDEDNSTARKLYDSYTFDSGKVQYRIPLDPND
ncbi:MAG: GNAT family N-acetyltransferase [Actinobacteria bacterium]|uniref:Unannotated protein n=1 Tax=freshwater metagenome TaxID=449393 RepID=A0A6J6T4D9_9ZZZZ|nr:GNAT family N-acetyltransferase [Actinomycetota bacterium]MSZ02800.1 GNAT family N-acetyltransferase [Actinomycetota bacterium]